MWNQRTRGLYLVNLRHQNPPTSGWAGLDRAEFHAAMERELPRMLCSTEAHRPSRSDGRGVSSVEVYRLEKFLNG